MTISREEQIAANLKERAVILEQNFANTIQTNYGYENWLNGSGRLDEIVTSKANNNQTYINLSCDYDNVGNVTKISDLNNGGQEQSFAYDSLNRLLSASTTAVGDGQYEQQSYSYDANTGNLNSRSGVGKYVYVYDNKPHAVVKAGNNTYQYDANGNMTRRTIGSVVWTYEYDAENHLVETKKNGLTENRYIYDGDGNRVARLDANDEGTIFIGNYFEARYPAEEELTSPFFDCAPEGSYCTYLPIVGNTEVNELFTGRPGVSYYYSGNQRIAMRNDERAYLLFSDHLGSSSVVMNANGELVEKAYYLPWGGERGDTSITSTDYGYTGQMKEGDIYYYGARWYDPTIGRFMQADTIVPLNVQGTQAFDRYAYVNNNPLRYTDPTGHRINNTNTMMTDTGSFERELTYEQLISNVFGVVLNPKTEFSQTQKQTVYSALITMASSASNNYGLNGTRWVRGFASGTMISNGGLVSRKLNAYVTLPGEIQMIAGFNENSKNTLIHEFGHILDNKSAWHGLGTYIGGGYSAELAKQAHVSQIRLLRFDHGYPEESAAYFFDDVNKFSKPHLYGNYSIADYFAEGFMAMIVNPSDPMLPTVVQEYFIDLFGGMR